MLLCLLLLFCDLMSVNFDWSIILIRKSFGVSQHISEKLGVKLAIAIFCGCTAWFVSDLVGNPEDRFSHDLAYIISVQC